MDRQAGHAVVSTSSARSHLARMTRMTVGGRTLRYDLEIIQQPHRARACGAGAKASADRRPVDPPPILSLRIFELGPNDTEIDISFLYAGAFFIFTSLESDRRLAQARGMPPVNNDDPKRDVLAGTNVTGASPFERPGPALYFIFPDLSVRHEGKYHFDFQLYESVKLPEDETRGDSISGVPDPGYMPRMKISSATFDVFSAKRFPGLTESTVLSRQLAEQGSRIRIRRDVRIRRPNNKPGTKDWADYNDENDNASRPSRLHHTPDPYGQSRHVGDPLQRPQSASSRGHPSTADSLSRRASLNDINQSYMMQQQQPPPAQQHQSQQQQQQQQQPPNVFTHPSAAYNPMHTQPYAQQSFMHPPPPQYAAPAYQPHAPVAPQQPAYSYYGSTQQQQQQMQYPPISTNFDSNPYSQRNSGEYSAVSNDSRRASMQSIVTPGTASMYSQPAPAPSHQQSSYAQQPPVYADGLGQAHGMSMQPQQQQQQQQQQTLATDVFSRSQPDHGDALRPPTRVTTPHPPTLNTKTNFPTKLPPLSTSVSYDKLEASPSSVAPANSFSGAVHTPTESHKRPYASSFATGWQNLSNKQGARPGDNNFFGPGNMTLAADDGDSASDSMEPYDRTVTYRRAGGATTTRTHL